MLILKNHLRFLSIRCSKKCQDLVIMQPLHQAAWKGYLEITKLLNKQGAYINAINEDTPLQYTADEGTSK